MPIKNISSYFLIACLLVIMYLMLMIFMPFLTVIFLAIVVATISYPAYEWLLGKLKNRAGLASFLMCILILLVIVLPMVQLAAVFATKSVETYKQVEVSLASGFLEELSLENVTVGIKSLPLLDNPETLEEVKNALISAGSKLNAAILSFTGSIIKSTASFVMSLIFFIFSLYYFFKDGRRFLHKLMHWTPLSNKYDQVLFEKFREMSISTIVSTFVVALVQGVVSAIGYMIVGAPAFFLGVATGFAGLIPMIGAAVIWVPTGITFLLLGKVWQGLFVLIYGAIAVSLVDNVIRPFMIEGRTKVHPLLIFFSILGGVSYIGGLGFIFGPLILSVCLTLLHIYEMEYDAVLDKHLV